MERVHQVLHNMIVTTKDLNCCTFDCIDPWGEILSSIAWAVRASHHHSTFNKTPGQHVFGRDMVFNLSTVIDWKAIIARKQAQIDRDNLRENANRVSHDHAIGDQVYVKIDGIKQKLDNKQHVPYRITQIHTNGTVQIQKGNVNKHINIRRLEPHFELYGTKYRGLSTPKF